jgi:hypothetical protein
VAYCRYPEVKLPTPKPPFTFNDIMKIWLRACWYFHPVMHDFKNWYRKHNLYLQFDRYQMIEDEDHVQLGGMAHFQDFVLPFVYINGYKYTPLKDALTIFTQDCCVSACTIPRSVLQKHKTLVKSFSTWEQVTYIIFFILC